MMPSSRNRARSALGFTNDGSDCLLLSSLLPSDRTDLLTLVELAGMESPDRKEHTWPPGTPGVAAWT